MTEQINIRTQKIMRQNYESMARTSLESHYLNLNKEIYSLSSENELDIESSPSIPKSKSALIDSIIKLDLKKLKNRR